MMNSNASNKIVYIEATLQVVGLYIEGSTVPVGCLVGDCDNFHRHFHLSSYNPETQMMEIAPEKLSMYIDAEKKRFKREVSRQYDIVVKQPIRFAGRRWDADTKAVANISKWLEYAKGVDILPDGFAWRDAENKMVPFDDPSVLATHLGTLFKLIMNREAQMLKTLWAEKERIDALSTLEDVEMYTCKMSFYE